MKKTRILKRLLIVVYYFFALVLSSFTASIVTNAFSYNFFFEQQAKYIIPMLINLVAGFLGIIIFKILKIDYKNAGVNEMLRIVGVTVTILCFDFLLYSLPYTRPYFTIRWIFTFVVIFFDFLILGIYSYRLYLYTLREFNKKGVSDDGNNVLIVGAGAAGAQIVKEINTSEAIAFRPIGFIDDNPLKLGKIIDGVEVLGNTDDITKIVSAYHVDKIFIAMPSVSTKIVKTIINKCDKTGCELKILPGAYQVMNSEVMVSRLRDVDICDLLARDQINVDLEEIFQRISGRTVLVTGGGGSIGSELCRQIAGHKPKRLIILDIYENNAYDIEQELKRHMPNLPLTVLIASIRDQGRIDDIFKTYRPQLVFNAAAHKHVPLMEGSPREAIKNNVFGTLNLAKIAIKYETECFVQISTDKAVNPTNVMGASKRLCEMIIQTMDKKSDKTRFVAVRFGNVLGSNGSVIPLFKEQIKEGGPVTVTDRNMERFFMTIPEAVALVLQASANAKGGEIFVLDMGAPVKIYSLAENLIRLSGYEPNVDIDIKICGLRPGEKLYEERLMEEEGLTTTENGMISIAKPIKFNEESFLSDLDSLKLIAYDENSDIREVLKKLVPTYHPENGGQTSAEKKAENSKTDEQAVTDDTNEKASKSKNKEQNGAA